MRELLIICLLTTSCASTYRMRYIQSAAIGAAIGGLHGNTKESFRAQNTALYASIGALTVLGIALFYNNPDREIADLKQRNDELARSLEDSQPKIIASSSTSTIPDEYKKLIRPGTWRLLSIDRWVEDGENRLIHQDKIIELIPPQFKTHGR